MNQTFRRFPARLAVLVLALQLTLPSAEAQEGPGKIAYMSGASIWLMEADGSGKQSLGISGAGAQLSPNGEWIIFGGSVPGGGGGSGLLLMRAAPYDEVTNVPILIGPDADGFRRASWHPSGNYVAYVGYNGINTALYLVEALDENGEPPAVFTPEQLTSTEGGLWFGDCAFSPDGRNLMTSQYGASLVMFQVFNANGARTGSLITSPLTPLTDPTKPAAWPSFSPDGKKVVFTQTISFVYEIAVLTIRDPSGNLTPEHPTENPRVIHTISPQSYFSQGHPSWSPDGSKILFYDAPSISRIVTLDANVPENGTTNTRVVLAGDGSDTWFPSFAHPGAPAIPAPDPAPVPPNLISWWPGENTAWDVVGIGEGSMKNGANSGANAYGVGKVGRAFSFDGIDDHVQGNRWEVQVGGNSDNLEGDFTIEAWVKPTAHSAEAVIVSKASSVNDDVSYSLLLRDGKPTFRASLGGNAYEIGTSSTTLPLNQWSHLAYTESAQGSRLALYINGVVFATSAAVTPRAVTTGPLTIGAFIDSTHPTATPGSPYQGLIDELTLYDRALSGTEIEMIRAAGISGKVRHDPARDFSATANPSAGWRYGWIDRNSAPAPSFISDGNPANGDLFAPPALLEGTTYNYGESPDAHLLFNKSTTARATFAGNGNTTLIDLGPRQFALHESTIGDYSALQWVVPESGSYAISSTFTGIEDLPTSTFAHFWINNSGIDILGVGGFLGDGTSTTTKHTLNEDDVVSWIVGGGVSPGNGYTGLVASAVLLEPNLPFARPSLSSGGPRFNAPLMNGKTVRFEATGARPLHPSMTGKIQYSATPGVPGSWIDLPGAAMTPSGTTTFILSTSSLPAGTFAFRVATTVEGLGSTFSTPSDTYTILPAGPYYEIDLDVSSGSDSSGRTTHRGDTLNYTARFRNSGGVSVAPTEGLSVLVRIPRGISVAAFGSSPGYEIVHSGPDTYAMWTLARQLNPVDAELAFTVSNLAADLVSCPNHGFDDGDLVTLKSTVSLPGGLADRTVYRVISSNSDQFQLALSGSTTPINLVNNGSGTHTVTRDSVFQSSTFTVASLEYDEILAGNHGLKEGYLVTLRQTSGGALPGGLQSGTIYKVLSVTRDEFQLALPGSSTPVDIVDEGTGTHELKRSDVWLSRTLRLNVGDPALKDEATTVGLNDGDRLNSFARLTSNASGDDGLLQSETVATELITPLRLTASVPIVIEREPGTLVPVPGDTHGRLATKLKQGARFTVDFTVKNGASYDLGSSFLRVLAPDDLAIHGGEFASGSGNPVLSETPNGQQLLIFDVGPLAAGAERVCRVEYRVQFDHPFVTPDDLFEYDHATASVAKPPVASYTPERYKQFYFIKKKVKGRKPIKLKKFRWRTRYIPVSHSRQGLERDLENPFLLRVEQAVGFDIPQLIITGFEHQGMGPLIDIPDAFGEVPEENKHLLATIETVADSALALPFSGTPPRAMNELLFKVDYVNSGNTNAEFIRIKVKMPNNTGYVSGSAEVLPDGIVHPTPSERDGFHFFTVPALSPGETNTLTYKVKLNAGTPVGTFILQERPAILSRELVKTHSIDNGLVAYTVSPAAMDYQPQPVKQSGTEWYHETTYQNLGGQTANGVGIRYYVPPGARFKSATYVDLLGNEVAFAGRTIPTKPTVNNTGTVIFTIGNVASKAFGRVRVVIEEETSTLPDRVLFGNQIESRWENYDSTTAPPTGPRSALVKESVQFVVPTPVIGDNPKPWIGIEGRRGAFIGEEITYQITVGNDGANTGNGFLAVPVPEGTELVAGSTMAVGHYRGGVADRHILGPLTGFVDTLPDPDVTYTPLMLDNVHGCVLFPITLQHGGSVIVKVTLRMAGTEGTPILLRPTFHLGKNSRVNEWRTYRFESGDPDFLKKLKMFRTMTGDSASTVEGSANQPNGIFRTKIDELSLTSRGVSIAGADFFQTPHGVVLVPVGEHIVAAGGGNLIGQDGASLIGQDGASVVSNDGAGFVMAGLSTTINLDIPNNVPLHLSGRRTADFVLRNAAEIVAAGGGNLIGVGVGSLIVPTQFFSLNNNEFLMGARLIGQDGASIANIIQDRSGFLRFERTGFPALSVNQSSLAVIVRSAGLITDKGAGIIGDGGAGLISKGGAGIVAAGGGNIVFVGQITYFPAGLIGQDGAALIGKGGAGIVSAGGGNIVAGGGGNIVAAGGGNIIQGATGIVAGGGGN